MPRSQSVSDQRVRRVTQGPVVEFRCEVPPPVAAPQPIAAKNHNGRAVFLPETARCRSGRGSIAPGALARTWWHVSCIAFSGMLKIPVSV
jgi:hypothetical protein